MDLETITQLLGIVAVSVGLASGVTKLILMPIVQRIANLEKYQGDLDGEIKDIRDKHVKRDEMNGHLAHLDKSLDEAKKDIREIRDLMQDFLRGVKS